MVRATKRHCAVLITANFLFASLTSIASAAPLDEITRPFDHGEDRSRDAEHSLNKAKRKLSEAKYDLERKRRDLEKATNELERSRVAVRDREKIFHAAEATRDSAYKALNHINQDINALARRLHGELSRLVNEEEVTLFDISWNIFAEYNIQTGSFQIWAEMPNGLKVSQAQIESALNGTLSLPEVDPAEMLAAAIGLRVEKQTNRDDVVMSYYRNAQPGERIWTSSRGFSELNSADSVADATIKAILSGGTTLSGSAEEFVRGELRDLIDAYAFLRDVAGDEADRILPAVTEAIFKHRETRTPRFRVECRWAKTTYTVYPAGETELVKFIPGLVKPNGSLGRADLSPQLVVVVTVVPRSGKGELPNPGSLMAKIGSAQKLSDVVLRKLPKPLVRIIGATVPVQPGLEGTFVSGLKQAFTETNFDELKPVAPGSAMLDLRQTPVGKRFSDFISKLKLGNTGMAELAELSINVHTGQTVLTCEMRAREEVKLAEALRAAKRGFADLTGDSATAFKNLSRGLDQRRAKMANAGRDASQLADEARKKFALLAEAQQVERKATKTYHALNRAVQAAQNAVDSATGHVERAQQPVDNVGQKIIHTIPTPKVPGKLPDPQNRLSSALALELAAAAVKLY